MKSTHTPFQQRVGASVIENSRGVSEIPSPAAETMSAAGISFDPPETTQASTSNDMASEARLRLLIPLAVASALFMDLMDSSALATALPTLCHVFHTNPFVLKFALTAYLVTIAVLVPASGWLSHRVGMKTTFMLAMAVFMVGSICCGLSNSVGQLIAARIFQGVGGSMMTPVGRNIIVASSPRSYLVKALAWFTLPAILGPLAGPPLAGAILEFGNWRWIFFINIPVGLLGLAIVGMFVPRLPRSAIGRFDWRGFLMLGLSITLAMLLIETGGLANRPLPMRILVLGAALLAAALYCRHALRHEAVVDIRLLRRDSLTVSLVSSWLQRLSLGAMPYLLPLLLQSAMGLSPLVASQIMTAMACGSMAARFVLPPILRRFGFKTAGMILAAMNAIMSASPALFHIGTPIALMMILMAATSLIRGLFFILTQTLAYADIEAAEVGHASVLFTVAQQLSYSMGVAMGAGLLQASVGDARLTAAAFQIPFIVIAVIGGLSVFAFIPLRSNAGELARGAK